MATCTARTTADSSSAQLYMAEEECWGANPLTVSPRPALTAVRFTGESLVHNQTFITTNEIRSDAQISDTVRTGVGATGDINFELSYGTFDRFFEGGLRNDWTDELDINSGSSPDNPQTVTIASPLNQLTVAGSPSPLVLAAVGRWIYVTGSTTSPSNNGFYRITANDGDGTVTVTPSFAAPESGTNLRIRGSHLRNGVTKKSYVIEKRFTDLSPIEVLYYTGMRVGGVSLEITPGQILTGSLSFLGKRGFAANTSIGVSEAEAPGGDVANAVENIGDIFLDDAALDADLTSLSFEVNNNTRDKPAVGNLGNIDIGLGRFNTNGNITMYFSSRVLYDKFLAATAHQFSFSLTIGSDAYMFNFPSIKFTSGAILAEGNDGDVVANMDFQARRDPTLGFTFSLDRFSNAVGDDLS